MAHTIEDAIEALRRLPAERQAELADYIVGLAASEEETEEVDPEHLAGILEGLEQAKRGQFAKPDRVARLLGLRDE